MEEEIGMKNITKINSPTYKIYLPKFWQKIDFYFKNMQLFFILMELKR